MRSLAVLTNGRVGAVRAGLRLCACILVLCQSWASVGNSQGFDATYPEDPEYVDKPEAESSTEEKPGVPTISAHSDLSFAVNQGDTVAVEVQAAGSGLTYKWIKGGETVCRSATCDLDTKEWGVGSHKFSLVVFNQMGSLFVKGKLRVLAVPSGYMPSRVRAPMVEATAAIETVSADDLVVATTTGRGFSYHGRKVQVLGPALRSLDWNEKLRTQAASTLRFGRDGMEEHLLGEQSAVYLVKGATDRRAVVLRHGVVRSRQLGGSPRWSVVVDPWLQVDVSDGGDVMVERTLGDGGKDDVVTVTTLRGNARIYRWTDTAGHAGAALNLPQGLEVRLVRAIRDEAPTLTQPDAKRMQRLFQMTTPHLLPGENPAKWGTGWTLQGDERPANLKDALKRAKRALKARDFVRVMEMLAPFRSEMTDSYEASLALGEAAVGLSLLETATTALEQAVELNAKAAEPHYLLGYVALAGQEWQRAVTHFEAASDLDHPKAQEVAYYLGVARHRLAQRLGARHAFVYSLWESGSPEVEASALKFLDQTGEEGWLDVRLGAGVFQDDNVFRSDTVDVKALGDGSIEASKSAGYMGNAGFTVYPVRSRRTYVSLAFDIARQDYLEDSLGDVGRMDQDLVLGFGLGFGGGDIGEDGRLTSPVLRFGLAGIAATTALGEERAIDRVGSALTLGLPRLIGLTLRFSSMLNIDPLPDRDDLLDPLADELVVAGDRSSRSRSYGLDLVPIAATHWRLGLNVDSAATTMRDEAAVGDGRKDLSLGLGLRFLPTFRQSFDLSIGRRTRTYPDSEDERKDTKSSVGVSWRWHYTPVLYQVVDVNQESQVSTREANAYKRLLLALRLGLDF